MGKGRKRPRKADSWNESETSEAVLARQAKCADRFEAYYKAQGIATADEWPAVMAAFKRKLPVTFRITAAPELAARLEVEIRETAAACDAAVPALEAARLALPEADRPSRAIAPIALTCLDWVPGRRAHRLGAERTAVRKSEAHKALHRILVAYEGAGSITRQEAVSMVPPLFLGAAPGDRVFDSCAAPGSKTTQLMEGVFPPASRSTSPLSTSTGVVVANDENLNRAHTLVHQCKRLGSPAWVCTHSDASLSVWNPTTGFGVSQNSSKIPTAVKTNSFPTILGPFVFAPRVLDD